MPYLFLGGSFNPVTKSHINILVCAKNILEKKLNISNIKGLIVPTTDKYPLKKILSNKKRFDMIKLSTNKYPWIIVEDIEFHHTEWQRTLVVLKELRNKYNDDIYFICGSDKIEEFDKHWNIEHVKEIISYHKLIVFMRHGYKMTNESIKKYNLNNRMIIIDNIDNFTNISSTKVRNAVKNESSISDLVHPEVEKYIKINGLYLSDSKIN